MPKKKAPLAKLEHQVDLSQAVSVKLIAQQWMVSPGTVHYWINEGYIAAASPKCTGLRDWVIHYQSVIDYRGQPVAKFVPDDLTTG